MAHLSTLSKTTGYISIACWLGAQAPQVVKNYHLKSCEGLSLPFLVTWLLGDFGNFIGCILTDQLPFQTYLAGYFCLVDLTLLFQFFHYRAKFATFHPLASRDSFTQGMSQSVMLPPAPPSSPHRTAISERPRHTRGQTEPVYGRAEHAAVYAAVLDVARAAERATRTRSRSRPSHPQMMESVYSERSTSTVESPLDMRASSASLLDRGRNMSRTGLELETREVREPSRSVSVRGSEDRNRGRRKAGVAFMAVCLLMTTGVSKRSGLVLPDHLPPPSFQRIVGRVSAWACTTAYLSSRLPQIWKNFTRRSVEGLSMYLFLFAFLGNTFYVMSILLNPAARGPEDPHYLLEALPYLLGSGGTLVFDITILTQSLIYGSAPPSDDTPYQRSKRLRYRRAHTEDGIEREPLMDDARDGSMSPDLAVRNHPRKAKTQP